MKLKNCPVCGKLYIESPIGMCPSCYGLEQSDEAAVASYVRDHPNSLISEIHQATNVKESTILRMIREGRFIEFGTIFYPCEKCGALIAQDRLCLKCKDRLTAQIEQLNKKGAQTPPTKGIGLYTNYYKNKSAP